MDWGFEGWRRGALKGECGRWRMPGSAFLLFANAKRGEVKEQHPELEGTGITKLLGQEWKKLSHEEKAEWKGKAAANESGGEEEEFGEDEPGGDSGEGEDRGGEERRGGASWRTRQRECREGE